MAEPEHPALEELQARLADEEQAYADVLAALDRLSALPVPTQAAPEIRERLVALNTLWSLPPPAPASGIAGFVQRQALRALAPLLERQQAYNAALVQLLNAYLEQASARDTRLRELASALVRYAQRVMPVVDARDRVATALATTRSELLLEAFDRRLESLARRLDAIGAARG